MKATELLERMKSNNVPLIVDARSEPECVVIRSRHAAHAIALVKEAKDERVEEKGRDGLDGIRSSGPVGDRAARHPGSGAEASS
jgi:hypothetical protein